MSRSRRKVILKFCCELSKRLLVIALSTYVLISSCLFHGENSKCISLVHCVKRLFNPSIYLKSSIFCLERKYLICELQAGSVQQEISQRGRSVLNSELLVSALIKSKPAGID